MYCIDFDGDKILLLANAIKVEVVTSNTSSDYVKFLNGANKIIALYRLSEIRGFYQEPMETVKY
jgi:hypothetical protein